MKNHSSPFPRLCGHQPVKLSVPGKTVLEGHNVPGTADEAAACRHIGDVGKLGVRDIQELGKLVPVGGSLVQHNQKLRVCQHEPGGIGPEQFLHVLG